MASERALAAIQGDRTAAKPARAALLADMSVAPPHLERRTGHGGGVHSDLNLDVISPLLTSTQLLRSKVAL